MSTNFKKDSFHVLTPIIMAIVFGVISFSTDQPLVILAILFLLSSIFIISGNKKKLVMGLRIFIPFAIFTIIINTIFVQGGRIVVFSLLGRNFTLESFIYSLFFSIKLLNIIYIFAMLGLMIDSDNAISYFSAVIPKTTLSLLISIKLVPNMKERFTNLKQIYKIRGVNYEGKSTKDKLKSYIPILSILLEDSLEGSFDIGEAAYVRGFLSTKKTIYERQHFKKKDYLLIFLSVCVLAEYVIFKTIGGLTFEIYSGVTWDQVINYYVAFIVTSILMIFLSIELLFD